MAVSRLPLSSCFRDSPASLRRLAIGAQDAILPHKEPKKEYIILLILCHNGSFKA
jgi:hypothetical protein